MEIAVGSTIDHFEVQRLLGGGDGTRVFLVKHRIFASLHALKLLPADRVACSWRTLQDRQAQVRIRHPNVVSVTDVVAVGNDLGLVMDYVEGTTLAEVLADGHPLPAAEIGPLFAEMCAGVHAAHRQGVLHGNLKPGNVLLSLRNGNVQAKIADFGLVEVSPGGARRELLPPDADALAYTAPELLRDQDPVDGRADVYALGCILYEMCCGQPAFHHRDVLTTVTTILAGAHVPLRQREPRMPAALCEAVERALRTDPDGRFPSAEALAAAVAATLPEGARAPAPSTLEVTMRPARGRTAPMEEAPLEAEVTLGEQPPHDALRTADAGVFWETAPQRPTSRGWGSARPSHAPKKRDAPRAPPARADGIVDPVPTRSLPGVQAVATVLGVVASVLLAGYLANSAALSATHAGDLVRASGDGLAAPWAEASNRLSTLLPGAESPDRLLAQAEAFRTATRVAPRIARGHDLVRSLRAEAARQARRDATAAAQAQRIGILQDLDRIDASLTRFEQVVTDAEDARTDWRFAVAHSLGWVDETSDPERMVLAEMPPVLVLPPEPVHTAATPRRRP